MSMMVVFWKYAQSAVIILHLGGPAFLQLSIPGVEFIIRRSIIEGASRALELTLPSNNFHFVEFESRLMSQN